MKISIPRVNPRTLLLSLFLVSVMVLTFCAYVTLFNQLHWSTEFQFRKNENLRIVVNPSSRFFKFFETDIRLRLYLELVKKNRVQVFLVDPLLLIPVVPKPSLERISKDPAVDKLIRNSQYTEDAKPPKVLLFGILCKDYNNIGRTMDRISEISKTQGFLFKYFEAPIPIPTEIKVDFPVVVGAPSLQAHLLLSKNNLSLHIHVFHFVVKSDFFWVADGLGSGSGEIPIGSRQTIFDQFLVQPMQLELDRKNSSRLKIFVPGNVAHFLQEIPHSIHISCNRDFAENYMKEHGAKYSIEDREKSDTKARFALRHTKQILENSLVSAWACAGTLLGWYRQCGSIPYTNDVDFCTLSTFASYEILQEAVRSARGSEAVEFLWKFGFPSIGFEFTFRLLPEPTTGDRFSADLFFLYPGSLQSTYDHVDEKLRAENWATTYQYIDEKGFKFEHMIVVKEFCSSNLMGYKIQVPCEPLPSLEFAYGVDDWKSPVKTFNEEKLSQMYYWNESMAGESFRSYRTGPLFSLW